MKNITVSRDKVEQWLEDLEYSDSDKNVIAAIKQALTAQPEPDGWAISYDGKTPYAIWPEGDGPLLDLEVKRQGGTCCKLPIYTTPPAAAVPDAIGPNEDELPAYAAGWNDCRQAMLEMMK